MTNTVLVNVDWDWKNDELDLRTTDTNDIGSFFDEPVDLPIEYEDDALTLSCVSYRLWREKHWVRWSRLEEVTDKVTDADREMAEKIREYYVSRLTFARLCDSRFTPFQQNLAEFLTNKKVLKTSEQGLLYCLPYFYAEDCEKDQIFNVTVPIEFKSDEHHPPPKHIVFDGVTLTPIKEIFSFRKTGDVHSFWFKNESNEPFVLEVKSGNALLNLVRGLFKREQITFKSSTRIVRMSGYRKKQNYWKLINPELVE